MRWALLPTAVLLGGTAGTAQADGWVDWFLTADQQGRLVYEAGDFAAAGEGFADPQWKGYALYRAGRYAEAAEALARLDSAEGALPAVWRWCGRATTAAGSRLSRAL